MDDKTINTKLSEVVKEVSEILRKENNRKISIDTSRHGQA
jgi:hypothetical protein